MSRTFVILVSLALLIFLRLPPPAVLAAAPPYPIVYGAGIGTNVSSAEFLDELTSLNDMYLFNNPYYSQSVLTTQRIQEIHTRLPQLKIFLHIFPSTMFDQKKLDSPIAKVSFSSQNTQAQFDNAWANHQDAFMKNANGEYVYNAIDPPIGDMWLKEEQGYLMDPSNSFYQNFLYSRIKYLITEIGYDGVYLDIMLSGFMKGMYYSRPAINGVPITDQQWKDKLIILYRALQDKRQNDLDPRMRNAFIFTNSVGGGKYTRGIKQYNIDLQTQGVQIENPFQDFTNMSIAKWKETVDLIKDITSLRNNQMRGWLHYHFTEGMTDRARCDQQSLFVYASYLLGNQSPDFAFLFLCKFTGNRIYTSNTLARIRLGNPSTQYQNLSSGLYLREYENGFALVNPTNSQHNWQTNRALKNAYNTTVYPANTAIPLPAHTGLVLLKEAPTNLPADLTEEDDTPGNQVNKTDYNLLLSDFGKTGSPGFLPADINNDGRVDVFDYNILVGTFGK